MTATEKNELIGKIFSDKAFFEAEVLGIFSNSDRIEVVEILAKRMVGLLLREELNFLYMKNLEKFSFSLIRNLMFREISNEWVSYSAEKLRMEHQEAVETLQSKKYALFLLALIREYFKHYKVYFAQEIADSFIDLIKTMPAGIKSTPLINQILISDFVKNENIVVVQNYSQIWGKVRNAHTSKNIQLTKLQVKISETKDRKEKQNLEYAQEVLSEKPLAFFDDTLLRLRNTMVQYMMGIDSVKA